MPIKKVENQDIEFKQIWQDEYLKWICAFANTKGGTLYIGVNDKGDVLGLADYHKLSEDEVNVSNEELIRNLHGFENDYITRAAVLSFHPDPEKWFTGAYVKIAYFLNDADILYQDEVHGSLMEQVERTMEILMRMLKKR